MGHLVIENKVTEFKIFAKRLITTLSAFVAILSEAD